MWFFKKKNKNEFPTYDGVIKDIDKISHCEIVWNRSDPDKCRLYGYDTYDNEKTYICDLFTDYLNYVNSKDNSIRIYCPKILYYVDWKYIFYNIPFLKSVKIEIHNFMTSVKRYTVYLFAVDEYGKMIKDSFTSTEKMFIDQYELTDNIIKFIRFAETYNRKIK